MDAGGAGDEEVNWLIICVVERDWGLYLEIWNLVPLEGGGELWYIVRLMLFKSP